jgi:hypothetical protein
MSRKPKGKSRSQAANVAVVGNSSVSEIAVGSEVVSNVYIRTAMRNKDENIQVKRDSNTAFVSANSGELRMSGLVLTGSNATLTVAVLSTNSFLVGPRLHLLKHVLKHGDAILI